jgi:sterol 24-C-methyltransferase
MKQAGFEILETRDYGLTPNPEVDIPWYDSLEGKYWSIASFKHTPLGMWLTNRMVWVLENLRIAPKGTLEIHHLLVNVAVQLVKGGKLGIFSPSYFYLARKPNKK